MDTSFLEIVFLRNFGIIAVLFVNLFIEAQ